MKSFRWIVVLVLIASTVSGVIIATRTWELDSSQYARARMECQLKIAPDSGEYDSGLSNDGLVVQDTTSNSIISIISDAGSFAAVFFGDYLAPSTASIRYDNSVDKFQFYAGGYPRMIIDGDTGYVRINYRLGIGAYPTTYTLQVTGTGYFSSFFSTGSSITAGTYLVSNTYVGAGTYISANQYADIGTNIKLGTSSSTNDDTLFFDDGISEFLAWDNDPGEFDLSDDLNVTGQVEMTGFKLTASPSLGYVLTSDATGVGTWQATTTTWTKENVQDTVGAMVTGNTETLITVTYEDGDGTLDFVVNSDLHSYSWTNVTGTDLKTGSVTQAYDADLADLADGTLTYSKVGGMTASRAVYSDAGGLLAVSDVTSTELGYLDGVTSSIQTQLNAKTLWTKENVQDTVGAMVTGNTETGIVVTYQDGDGTLDFEHSTANGYIHIPASGASTQLLQYSSAGTAKWITVSGDATIADDGAVTVADDSHAHTASTISGLSVSDFTSANISNWTNDAGYLVSTDINTSLKISTIVGDETGNGVLVFNTSPTFNTSIMITDVNYSISASSNHLVLTGLAAVRSPGTFIAGGIGINGHIVITNSTNYSASIYTHPTMASNASFYLPIDEPTITSILNMTSGGQIGFDTNTYLTGNQSITLSGDATGTGTTAITVVVVDDSHAHTASTISGLSVSDFTSPNISNWTNDAGYITATLTEEQVEDYVGGMVTGNTETLIAVTYEDGDGTLDFVVNSDLHSYSWTNVTGTDLKTGSVTQAYDADLADLADGTLTYSKVGGMTASRAVYSDAGGLLAVSDVTSTELGYLDGVTSSIQTQLNAKTLWTKENVQDTVGAMVTGNTETGIVVTYQDGDGTLDFEHSTANGYIHIPASGASAQILQYSSAGTAKWITVSGDATIADNGAVTVGADKITEAMLKAVNSATDEYYLTYESTTGDFEWVAPAGGGDLMSNGTVQLTANWDAGNYEIQADTLRADVMMIIGTPTVLDAALNIEKTINTTTHSYGVKSAIQKTAGVTDANDYLYGVYSMAVMNHASGVIGDVYGGLFNGQLMDGTATNVYGSHSTAVLGYVSGITTNLVGSYVLVDGNAGTATTVWGQYVGVDLESSLAAAPANVYGQQISMDVDKDPSGYAIMLYLTGNDNVDYGIYQYSNEPNFFQGSVQVYDTLWANKYGSDGSVTDEELLFINALTSAALDTSAISTSAKLAAILKDEVGSEYVVFGDSPTFRDDITLGRDPNDGKLRIRSEQGNPDFYASIYTNTAMGSDANFYLPADEPVGATAILTMTTGGVMGFDYSTYITATLTEEQVEDYVGGMVTGNTETLIAVTYEDGDGTLDFVVNSDLHSYSWTNVTGTDLKTGSVTQAYDADLADLADGTLTYSKVGGMTASRAVYSDAGGLLAVSDVTSTELGYLDGVTSSIQTQLNAKTFWTKENVQDTVGAMVTGNTETGITVTYQDGDGTLDFEHSTANGYIHIPASGASAQLLQYSSAGTAKWITVSGDATIADNGAVTVANDSHTHSDYINKNGTVALTGNWDAGAYEIQTDVLDIDVNVGIGAFDPASGTTLRLKNPSSTFTGAYYNVVFNLEKFGGASSGGDIDNLYLYSSYNQEGETIGDYNGIFSQTNITHGTAGTLSGIYNYVELENVPIVSGQTSGIYNYVYVEDGTFGDIVGVYNYVTTATTVTSVQNVYGSCIIVDSDKDPVGSGYGLYINTASNIDFPIFQTASSGYNYIGSATQFDGYVQLGRDGIDGVLKIYSDQATDRTAALYANTAMGSDANFYLPADEPTSTALLTMTSGGVMGFNYSTYLTGNQNITLSGDVSGTGTTAITVSIGADKITEAMLKAVNSATDEYVLTYESTTGDFEWEADTDTHLTEEEVEDYVGGMVTGNTETGIAVTYEDGDGTIDFVHSTANGYIHIPASGASAQILQYSSAGTAKWVSLTGEATIADGGAIDVAGLDVADFTSANLSNWTNDYLTTSATPGSDHTWTGGYSVTMTVGEIVYYPDALYLKSDGKLWKANATAAGKSPVLFYAGANISADASGVIIVPGGCFIRDDSWNWTVGGLIYLSTTDGVLTQTLPSTAGNQVQVVGVATHADRILVFPSTVLVEI